MPADDTTEDDDLWKPPAGLSADQLIDWEQTHQYANNARAIRHVGRRMEALERLMEAVIRPVVDESTAWTTLKRQIADTLWNSGFGPVKTGPSLVAIVVIVGLAVVAQQCGVDPIELSRELRGWKDGECVPAPAAAPSEIPGKNG